MSQDEWFTLVDCVLNHVDNDYIKDLVVLSAKDVYKWRWEGELGKEEAVRRWIFHQVCRRGEAEFYRVVEHVDLCYRRIVKVEVGLCDDGKRLLLWDGIVDSLDFDDVWEFWEYLETCRDGFLTPKEYESSV
jgi:hypothetical protein